MLRSKFAILTVAILVALATGGSRARALEIQVTVDSSSIPAATAGSLDFQFSAGLPTAQTATATVTNFASTALTLSGISFTNSASGGPLPATVTILNNPAFLTNRARQAVTFENASSMSFTLNITGNALTTPSSADSTFYFSLLNSSNQSIFGEYSLPHLSITIPANGSGTLSIAAIPFITATVVPEPGTIALAMAASVTLALSMRRKARKSS